MFSQPDMNVPFTQVQLKERGVTYTILQATWILISAHIEASLASNLHSHIKQKYLSNLDPMHRNINFIFLKNTPLSEVKETNMPQSG